MVPRILLQPSVQISSAVLFAFIFLIKRKRTLLLGASFDIDESYGIRSQSPEELAMRPMP